MCAPGADLALAQHMIQHIESSAEMEAEDPSTPRPDYQDALATLADALWSPGEVVPKEGTYRCVRCHKSRSLLPGDWAPGCSGHTSQWVFLHP
jgi:hypothetical protein